MHQHDQNTVQPESNYSLQARLQLHIPDYVPQVLELFQGSLAEVEFPGISREVLVELAQRVESKSRDLERLQHQVDELQKELESGKVLLTEAARQGLAYAQVYSESDTELAEAIKKIKMGEPLKGQGKSRSRSSRKKRLTSRPPTCVDNEVLKAATELGDGEFGELALQPSLSA